MPKNFVSILVYIFCFCSLNLCKESREDNLNDDCFKCRVFTDSFNNWLEKTSRGKHEGGDVAWEESKLKNYARSEMRLVEIQESLCSDLKSKAQDHCYALAGEVETLIEKWWHEESPSKDLYSWLCIDELEYCCPKNHFGAVCRPCLVNDNNEICNGQGKCDGDGTRKGNGSCICKTGYDGSMCDKCTTNYFYSEVTKTCDPCHKSCNECIGISASDCTKCASGWTFKSGECVDINECFSYIPVCIRSEYCINSEGSYTCKTCHNSCATCVGAGPSNCSSCYDNDLLLSGKCLDDDEQHNLIKQTWLRSLGYCFLLTFSFTMFRKSIWVTSIFVLSITALYLYLEAQYEGGLVHAIVISLYNNL